MNPRQPQCGADSPIPANSPQFSATFPNRSRLQASEPPDFRLVRWCTPSWLMSCLTPGHVLAAALRPSSHYCALTGTYLPKSWRQLVAFDMQEHFKVTTKLRLGCRRVLYAPVHNHHLGTIDSTRPEEARRSPKEVSEALLVSR